MPPRAAALALLLALLARLRAAAAASPFEPSFHRGIVFGAGEWSSPDATYDSPQALASLQALAATGASHVRLLVTGYLDNTSSATQVYSAVPPSALATETVAAVQAAIAAAQGLGLKVTLCPVLDPNWDVNEVGARSNDKPGFQTRQQFGRSYTSQSQWDAFFMSYRAWVFPYYRAAAAANVAMIEVSSELETAFSRPENEAAWRSIVADIRSLPFAGLVSVANADPGNAWLSALDLVGIDVYNGLGPELPLGQPPAVADLVAQYEAQLTPYVQAFAARNLSVFFSETGFQSRPNCHVRPWGTPLLDVDDDSAWVEYVDVACQANALEALMRYLASQPLVHGVYLWLWRSDPTTGGTFNSDFTPHGKPAEVVIRRWFGGFSPCAGNSSRYPPDGPMRLAAPFAADGSDNECDGSAAILRARAALQAATGEPSAAEVAAADRVVSDVTVARPYLTGRGGGALAPHPRTKRSFNGFCYGTPDEWSSPFYRLPSAGSLAALDDMVASTAADSVEIIVQWWFDSINSTLLYPITDPESPLWTSTDEELAAFALAAKARGLKTVFTTMLDPNWLLPAQSHCRDTSAPGCYWRGQIGTFWGEDCSDGTPWAAWHENYAAFSLHYARLAESWGVDALLLSHELYLPSTKCPARWAALLAAVRGVFSGAVSSVLPVDKGADPAAEMPWALDLDFLGVDCYFAPQLPPGSVPDTVGATWRDVDQATMNAAGLQLMPSLAAFSAALGNKPIVCTELGTSSRPWSYTTWGGQTMPCPEDCSVWDQCVSVRAMEIAYTWWLTVYYAQPWFDGFLFWSKWCCPPPPARTCAARATVAAGVPFRAPARPPANKPHVATACLPYPRRLACGPDERRTFK